MKTAVIAGSTGLVGSQLLFKLLESDVYSRVIAPVRKPLQIKHPKLHQVLIDFDQLTSYSDQLKGDDYFCCLGTTMKKAGSKDAFYTVDFTYCYEFAKIAAIHYAKNFLLISAIGSKASSSIYYSQVKGQLEEAVKQLPLPLIHIFHPSFLLGNRLEFRLGEIVGGAFVKVIAPMMFGRLRKYRPIEATKVARAMLNAAQTNPSGRVAHYTYEEMMRLQ